MTTVKTTCPHCRATIHTFQAPASGSDPKTEAGRVPSATLRLTGAQLASIDPPIGPEWFVDWDETAEFVERDRSARLVSPADREGQVAVLHAALDEAYQRGVDGTEGALVLLEAIEAAGLRLGQREDAPLDAAALRTAMTAIGITAAEQAAIEAEYQRLRESKP